MTILLSASFCLFAAAPQHPPAPPGSPAEVVRPAEAAAPARLDPAAYDHFGTGITQGEAPTTIADAQKDPAKFAGKTVRLEGPITAICQTKGCWMHLGTEQNPVMVKFKDYGFFMPKDATGRTAIVEGEMKWKQETVEETKHYLEDAGKKDEAAKVTEGRKILTFVAAGVAIKKADKAAPSDK